MANQTFSGHFIIRSNSIYVIIYILDLGHKIASTADITSDKSMPDFDLFLR